MVIKVFIHLKNDKGRFIHSLNTFQGTIYWISVVIFCNYFQQRY
jgi:hypothetical protein